MTTSTDPHTAALLPFFQSQAGFDEVLAQHAMGWHQRGLTTTQVSQAITQSAVALLPAARAAAILVWARAGELTVRATYGEVAEMNLAAANAPDPPHPVADWINTIQDMPSPNRWPVFSAPADPLGHVRILHTPLGSDPMSDTLTVAADQDGLQASAMMLGVLAMHAGTALAAAQGRDHLEAALQGRDVIGQAKGILMERRRLTADDAFTHLVRLSQINGTKLRDLCTHVADTGDIPNPATKTNSTGPRIAGRERGRPS